MLKLETQHHHKPLLARLKQLKRLARSQGITRGQEDQVLTLAIHSLGIRDEAAAWLKHLVYRPRAYFSDTQVAQNLATMRGAPRIRDITKPAVEIIERTLKRRQPRIVQEGDILPLRCNDPNFFSQPGQPFPLRAVYGLNRQDLPRIFQLLKERSLTRSTRTKVREKVTMGDETKLPSGNYLFYDEISRVIDNPDILLLCQLRLSYGQTQRTALTIFEWQRG